MLRIADQHYTTLKIKDHGNDNIFCRYTDRANCLHNMLWHIYGLLEVGKSVKLIVDTEENLKAVNYFISRYRLSHVTSIKVNDQWLNHLSREEDNHHYLSTDQEELSSNLIQEIDIVKEKIIELTRPCFGDMSIIELNDRQLVQHTPVPLSATSISLLNQVSNADLVKTKAMLKRSQDIYDPSYRHLDKLNPFKKDIIHDDINSVRSYLSDTISNVNKLQLKFDACEQKITESNSSEILEKISYLRSIQNNINRLKKQNPEVYTPAEIIKIKYNIDLIRSVIKYDSTSENNLNKEIEALSIRLKGYCVELREQSSMAVNEVKKMMTLYSSDIDFRELYNDVVSLQQHINTTEVLAKKYDRKAVSFYNLKVIVDEIDKDLDYALFFTEYNDNYLRWNKYYETLSPVDQEVITHLVHEKSSWEDSIEAQLSQAYIDQSLLRVESVAHSLHGIYDAVQKCINSNASLIKQNHSSIYSGESIKVRPIQVYYNSQVDYTSEENVDAILFLLNDVTAAEENFNTTKIFAYNEKFDEVAVARLKTISHLEIINDSGVYYAINKKLDQLKSHELNLASLYLGQLLRSLNSNYSIFKLKSVAIVSFLSELKNVQVRELLYSEGVKEIFSNVDNYNLLPGIFSDTTVRPIVLLEDGLFDKYNTVTVVRQILIRQELATAGIEVMEIDNYSLINKKASMSDFMDSIAEKNNQVSSHKAN